MADKPSKKPYREALEILRTYYREVVEDLAREVSASEDELLGAGHFAFSQIENRYVHRLGHLSTLMRVLRPFAADKSEKAEKAGDSSRLVVDEVPVGPEGFAEALTGWIREEGARRELLQVIPETDRDDGEAVLIVISREQ